MKLLHIIASPRADESRTLILGKECVKRFQEIHAGAEVDELNLFEEPLPPLVHSMVNGKYVLLGGKDLAGEMKAAWAPIEAHIRRFLSADGYLISTPMWNFSIPYVLKHYIDLIVQPRYLFKYSKDGYEGLVKGKPMVVVTTRGGDYTPQSGAQSYDLQEPYLRTIFGFVGIEEIYFIHAQPMDAAGPDVAREKIREAIAAIDAMTPPSVCRV